MQSLMNEATYLQKVYFTSHSGVCSVANMENEVSRLNRTKRHFGLGLHQ